LEDAASKDASNAKGELFFWDAASKAATSTTLLVLWSNTAGWNF